MRIKRSRPAISPAEIIRASKLWSAYVVKAQAETVSIEVVKFADLIMLDPFKLNSANVAFWHKADMRQSACDVCFHPKNGHQAQ